MTTFALYDIYSYSSVQDDKPEAETRWGNMFVSIEPKKRHSTRYAMYKLVAVHGKLAVQELS